MNDLQERAKKYNPKSVFIEIGTKFHSWAVLEYLKHGIYRCQCDCGKQLRISSHTLRNGERKACKRCHAGMPEGEAIFNEVYNGYKTNAKFANRIFELSKEQAKEFFKSDCHYCGAGPSNTRIRHSIEYKYNGIDRQDNAVGYVLDNCIPCCYICNHMKHIMPYEDFLKHVKRIVDYRGTLNGGCTQYGGS